MHSLHYCHSLCVFQNSNSCLALYFKTEMFLKLWRQISGCPRNWRIWGKLLLRKDMDSEFWAYLPWQLSHTDSRTFKPLSGRPVYISQSICRRLPTISAFPMHALALYLHLFIHVTLKDSNRFRSNRDTRAVLYLRCSANSLHSGKCSTFHFKATSITDLWTHSASLQTAQEYITDQK